MSIKPLDTFICDTVKLFEVGPSQSVFHLSYKAGAEGRNGRVFARCRNPQLDASHKVSTVKSKDLSRILSAMGPRGVTVSMSKVEKKAKSASNNKLYQKKKSSDGKVMKSRDVVGLGSLMVNTDVQEYTPAVASDPSEVAGKSKGKKNKNKNKKKR